MYYYYILIFRQHIIAADPTLTSTKAEVIQCQRCGRNRHFPAYIDRNQLPTEWFCEYNTWDKNFCSCEDEDDEKEREKDKEKEKERERDHDNHQNNEPDKDHDKEEEKDKEKDKEKEGTTRIRNIGPAIWGVDATKIVNPKQYEYLFVHI